MLVRLAARQANGFLTGYDASDIMRRGDMSWDALARLLQHLWFGRAWVIQEAAVGSNVQIMYGNIFFKWNAFALATRALMQTMLVQPALGMKAVSIPQELIDTIQHIKNADVISRFRETRHTPSHLEPSFRLMSLLDALMASSTFLSTDPRDKVFALLGITKEGGEGQLVPDYSKTTAEVYCETMQLLLLRHNVGNAQFHPLENAGTGFPRHVEGLPSWVVDWSTENKGQIPIPLGEAMEARNRQFWRLRNSFTVLDDNILKLDGFKVDSVR